VKDGRTLKDHSTAAFVDPVSNNISVVYSFVWER
jgi:hypothetical protein